MTAPVTFSLALQNETATAHLMADLALLVGPGDVITLSGDLGAGKTAAARAMIRYLAGDDSLEVPSPTFTLVQTYDLPPFALLHADLYRVNDPAELEEIGLSPLPEATLALIEWPERAPSALPADRIELKVDVDPNIGSFVGDERRVVQVLYNLLANAVGFSPQDATVGLSAKRTEHSVVFAVTDSGPGIPPDVKDKVFDWFESHSHGSRHRGAGLGLSLVRSFVELHGGKVRVDSIVGKGTTVTCDFPIDQAAHRNAAE